MKPSRLGGWGEAAGTQGWGTCSEQGPAAGGPSTNSSLETRESFALNKGSLHLTLQMARWRFSRLPKNRDLPGLAQATWSLGKVHSIGELSREICAFP